MAFMVGEDRERLANYVVRRRVALGYKTREQWAAAIGLSTRTLGDIEKGRRPVGDATIARIEDHLGWKPGSTAAILRGGNPELVAEVQDAEPQPEPEEPAVPGFLLGADEDLRAIWAGLEAIPQLAAEERIHAITLIKALRGAAASGQTPPTTQDSPRHRNAS
ncbi:MULTISPECIES: helix-turn-helix transcriptional regulator [unclassified Nonomuraea]|uniref:helix-turn-helix domain-containing protein n=1 Tax=unclassified Nonomuraea TaxID=2593643 RepID=UPI0033E940D5